MSWNLMNGVSNPRAAQLTKKNCAKDEGNCDNCGLHGIWYCIDGDVVCNSCLELSIEQERIIINEKGKQALNIILIDKVRQLFERDTPTDKKM